MDKISKNKASILIVADDTEIMQLLEDTLFTSGYEVILSDRSKDTVSIAEEKLPDVIFIETPAPGTDGFEDIRIVKESKITGNIPIIIITDRQEADKRLQALTAGVDDFIIKPLDEAELQARVKSLIKVKAYNDHIGTYREELETEVTKRTQELTRAFEKIKIASLDTVYRLSRAAEYKDEDTGAHVQRMSHYSSAIARGMGLNEEFIENILWAAPMHDVGKIGIPDRVLLKPGKLDDDEWVLMRQHTTIGAEILKDADSDFIRLAAEIALTHHEKWTGGGYPNGITGEDIPLAGRIVALADVFDALTTERPYKEPFPLEKALAIINEGKGTHFDPHVADTFFTIRDEIEAELNWWKFMSSDGPEFFNGL
ncbi:HD domain-containing phosphohydrolase [Chloroflexota bacterium]